MIGAFGVKAGTEKSGENSTFQATNPHHCFTGRLCTIANAAFPALKRCAARTAGCCPISTLALTISDTPKDIPRLHYQPFLPSDLDSLAWLGQAAPLDRRHERRGRFGNWSVFASGSPQQNAQARRMRPRHLLPQDVRGRSCALAARHWDTQKHSAAKRTYIAWRRCVPFAI